MVPHASEESFRTLFEPHRRAITLHSYRMLGSLQEAEEIVQETLLRAWQRQDDVRSTSATLSWLYRIATNACLDLLKTRRRRAMPHMVAPSSHTAPQPGAPVDERLWLEPAPDTLLEVTDDAAQQPEARVSLRESIGLAFVTALQFLSPKQRAALGITSFSMRGGRVVEMTRFTSTKLFPLFGLAGHLPSNAPAS